MGRRSGLLTGNQLVRLLHEALRLEGVKVGDSIPRDVWDDLVMVAIDVGPTSINSYNRRGEAQGLWRVIEAHGKGGQGEVLILDPVDLRARAELRAA